MPSRTLCPVDVACPASRALDGGLVAGLQVVTVISLLHEAALIHGYSIAPHFVLGLTSFTLSELLPLQACSNSQMWSDLKEPSSWNPQKGQRVAFAMWVPMLSPVLCIAMCPPCSAYIHPDLSLSPSHLPTAMFDFVVTEGIHWTLFRRHSRHFKKMPKQAMKGKFQVDIIIVYCL